MNWQLNIKNNTNSKLRLGLLDASNPSKPISIITNTGYDYVDVPYQATYYSGDSFDVVIGGNNYNVTLTSSYTPEQVCELLTDLGLGFWGSSYVGSNTRFTFVPSGEGRLSSMTYTPFSGTGWNAQNSGTTNGLYSIFFTDSNTGWCCGLSGTILKTTNGGSSWTAQSSGTTYNLWSIQFIDSNIGFVCGDAGIILKTTNGGSTWTNQFTVNHLYSIFFTNSNTGWCCGSNGTILKTTNGGTTWSAQSSGTTYFIRSIFFKNSNIGWCCGGNGLILHTTTGGD